MSPKRVNIAGNSPGSKRLWNTYVFWAILELDPRNARSQYIANPALRIADEKAAAIRAIIFAAFVLEYRLKRVQEELGAPAPRKATLGQILDQFQRQVEGRPRLDGQGVVRMSAKWPRLLKRLQALKTLRNNIAHAKYSEVLRVVAKSSPALRRQAIHNWNTVVDAIAVTNWAIGYDNIEPGAMTSREAREHYARLRVR